MKRALSHEEIEYVRKSILSGVRLDSRKLRQKRELKIVPQTLERSDGLVHVKRGFSEVEVSVRFEENDFFLLSLNLLDEEEFEKRGRMGPGLSCDFFVPFDVERYLVDFFKEFKLSINIQTRVIHDDGNIISAFFDALKAVFTDISVPVFVNMKEYAEKCVTIQFPSCESIASIEEKIFEDPTFLEETSSDFVLHLLRDSLGHVVGIHTTSQKNISYNQALNLLVLCIKKDTVISQGAYN